MKIILIVIPRKLTTVFENSWRQSKVFETEFLEDFYICWIGNYVPLFINKKKLL